MTPINLKWQLVTTREEARKPWPKETLCISPKQREFILNKSYVCGAIGSYGGGKTDAAALKMLRRLSLYPKAPHMVISNTYMQLFKTTLRVYQDVFTRAGLKRDQDYVFGKKPLKDWGMVSKYEDHEAVYSFRNGAQLLAVSADRWSVHDGQNLMTIHADEFCFFDPDCYDMLVGRLRGWEKFYPPEKYPEAYAQFFCSTIPNAQSFPYEIFEGDTKRKNSWYVHFRTDDNLWIEDSFAKDLTDAIGEDKARVKVEGCWTIRPRGRVYPNFDKNKHVALTNP